MITVLLILGCMILVISLLLIAPVIIHIDTNNENYYIKIPWLFSTRLDTSNGNKRLRARILLIPFSISLDKMKERGPGFNFNMQTGIEMISQSRFKIAPGLLNLYLKSAIELIRSFRFKRLNIELDTGDYTLNARLIPVILLARRQNIEVSVNFIENNNLIMIIQNRIYRIVWQAIKFYINYRKT